MSDFLNAIIKNENILNQVYKALINNCDSVQGNLILQRFLDEIHELKDNANEN